jgi:hypothetical protein
MNHHAMKTYKDIWGSEDTVMLFLNSALGTGERSASSTCRFTPGETSPTAHFIGGWVGSRDGLGTVENRKTSCPSRESNLDSSVVQTIA